ncbi:MAG: glutamate synthase, partial [Deltaproteobacteria bacterium]|nr:glutamate synthase [Deltaproteobacteria bacterium]
LDVRPPDVWRYFVRVKKDVLARFIEENELQQMEPGRAEDEFISQNSTKINDTFYASLGTQRAFVLSHGRNVMILKIVGFAEKVVQYYCLNDFHAHGWIAHQRFPTKGRVWHPGGAHPFSGMDEALVHNGDFANYHAVGEYLQQHNIYPQFLTDTEVSIKLVDLYNRTFHYPMEYIIEALAPTSEHDFDMLPPARQRIYRYIQSVHTQCSPDGPWFFIIARNNPYKKNFQLIGITDTAMLRPQVFALQDGPVQIGLICSEKQAIDATLQNLAAEDNRICPVADKYWNARGGSASDGGAFIFTVRDSDSDSSQKNLVCTNKFGEVIGVPRDQAHYVINSKTAAVSNEDIIVQTVQDGLTDEGLETFKTYCCKNLELWGYDALGVMCRYLIAESRKSDAIKARAIALLTHLNDRRYPTGDKKHSSVLQILRNALTAIFADSSKLTENSSSRYRYIDRATRDSLRAPFNHERVLVINTREFAPEGDDCDSRLITDAYALGWKQFICYGYKGQRFTGCGLSTGSIGVRIDVYDSS